MPRYERSAFPDTARASTHMTRRLPSRARSAPCPAIWQGDETRGWSNV